MTAILEVEDIAKSYGGIKALSACSVSFAEGAINGLIGPNGSGKTTLFNVMTGYERADSGAVRLFGRDITKATPDQIFRMGVGRSFQLTRVFPRLSVIENVHVAHQRRGLAAQLRRWTSHHERQVAREVLDFVGLTRLAHEPAGSLSHGQQKLLEFAFGVVARPKLMLLDEPASGVNPTLLRHLAGRIRALNDEGVTFVIVEHDMEFLMGLADHVIVMHQGALLASGPPAQVRANPDVLEAYLGGHIRRSG
ncbi:MAG TPA: ABC transporter ATP-binding protein [Streptosporangiaceae bacterium]